MSRRKVLLLAVLLAGTAAAWWWMTPYQDPRLAGMWISDPDPDTKFSELLLFSADGSLPNPYVNPQWPGWAGLPGNTYDSAFESIDLEGLQQDPWAPSRDGWRWHDESRETWNKVRSWGVWGNELRITQQKEMGMRWGTLWWGITNLWEDFRDDGRVSRELSTKKFEILEIQEDQLILRAVVDNHRPTGRLVVLRRYGTPRPPLSQIAPADHIPH